MHRGSATPHRTGALQVSDKHHKSSLTDILFFVAIVAVVVLVLAGNSNTVSSMLKTAMGFFK